MLRRHLTIWTAPLAASFACSGDDTVDEVFARGERGDAGQPLVDAAIEPEPVPIPRLAEGSNRCPSGGGSPTAFVAEGDGYCIDRAEATQSEFDTFLNNATPSAVPAEPPEVCSGYTRRAPHPNLGDAYDDCPTFTPYDPIGTPNLPVVCVDYCDAHFFCRAAGKRLCGSLEGMPLDLDSSPTNGRDNEWVRACGGPDLDKYPYGRSFDDEQCVAEETQVIATQQCEGATTGVHDLVGNVAEWTDECDDGGCIVRGGDSSDVGDADALSCTGATKRSHDTRDLYVGIRCCANRLGSTPPPAPTPSGTALPTPPVPPG